MTKINSFVKRYGKLFQSVKRQREKEKIGESCKLDVSQIDNYLLREKLKRECEQNQERESKVYNIVTEDVRLRKYQQEAVQNILEDWRSGYRNVMLQMPTGTGKTRLFVALINVLMEIEVETWGIKDRPRFLIVTHREELVEQISDTLISHYHLDHNILGKNKQIALTDNNTTDNICVSSIQYLSRQLKNSINLHFDFIIIDEAHHSLAESYTQLWKFYPDAYKLGVTATPYRLKGQGFTQLYDVLIKSRKVTDFIEQGYLADYRFFTVSSRQAALQKVNRLTTVNISGDYQTKDLQDIYANSEELSFLYDCYKEHTSGKKGIIYAVNQLHAEMIAEYFAERGVSIANIDSKTAKGKRKELISRFRNGELQVLVNVELFGEGFDCPSIEFTMLARPTKSLTVYLQQVGRALRPTGDNSKVVILDCVGLYNRFGMPEDERNWNLFFVRKKKEKGEFAKPLGLDTDSVSMTEIDTPRMVKAKNLLSDKKKSDLEVYYTADQFVGIRNQLGTVIVRPVYKELTKTDDGWFYGKDEKGNTVVFDKAGTEVFRRGNSSVVLKADGRFIIRIMSADGKTFVIGPYDQRMCIEPKFLCGFNARYTDRNGWYNYQKMYYLRDNYIAMDTFRLSLGTYFFRKTAMMPYGIVLLDLDMHAYTFSDNGKIIPIDLSKSELETVLKKSSAWGKKEWAIMGRF